MRRNRVVVCFILFGGRFLNSLLCVIANGLGALIASAEGGLESVFTIDHTREHWHYQCAAVGMQPGLTARITRRPSARWRWIPFSEQGIRHDPSQKSLFPSRRFYCVAQALRVAQALDALTSRRRECATTGSVEACGSPRRFASATQALPHPLPLHDGLPALRRASRQAADRTRRAVPAAWRSLAGAVRVLGG